MIDIETLAYGFFAVVRTLNQIFAGMLPFMGIQVVAIVLLYQFPGIGLWLPQVLYR